MASSSEIRSVAPRAFWSRVINSVIVMSGVMIWNKYSMNASNEPVDKAPVETR